MTIQFANCYGRISFKGVGTNHAPADTPQKIVDFDTEISSDGVTGSHAANTITINSAGAYKVFLQLNALVSDDETYTLYLAVNDQEAGSIPIDIERKTGVLSFMASGFVQNLSVADELSLYVSSTDAGGADFTPSFLEIDVFKVGT